LLGDLSTSPLWRIATPGAGAIHSINGGQRLALDGTVIRTRLDRKATNISVLAAIGVRRDGQKILLSIRNMGGESISASPVSR
jgi:hypothetical protein